MYCKASDVFFGKGQTKLNSDNDIEIAWQEASKSMRGDRVKVIIEEFISFNSEITLLTVKQKMEKQFFVLL